MSASVTATWQVAASIASGAWTDTTHWSTASVPGAGTIVDIPSVSAAPWTITVAGAQSVAAVTLDPTTALQVPGGNLTLLVGSGAALAATGNLLAYQSAVEVDGGTITVGGESDLDGTAASLQGGALWQAGRFDLGYFNVSSLLVQASTLQVTSRLYVGADSYSPLGGEGTGSLNLTQGGLVTATTLDVVNGSAVTVDATSAIVIGSSADSVAGALVVTASNAASVGAAELYTNVVVDGTLDVADAPSVRAAIGGYLSGTGTVSIAAGDTLAVASSINGFSGTISMEGGTLDLGGLAWGSGQTAHYNAATGIVSVGTDAVNVGKGLSPSLFSASADGGTGTELTEATCYAAGTRIATEAGEVAVEMLQVGDLVRTAGGRLAPVRWVGRMDINLTRLPNPATAAPVCIGAGAFAPGLPRRDLLVSPDHAMFIDGVLVQARKLLNDATIRQRTDLRAVTYVHVELDRHDLLLAEGVPAESYLDTGNRWHFGANARLALPRFDLDPEAAALAAFAERGCAELVLRGPRAEAAHARLLARAQSLGWTLTNDPDLRIEGERFRPMAVDAAQNCVRALLPQGTRQVRLMSRTWVPEAVDAASGDGRRLGVPVGVMLDGAWPNPASFGTGWYAAQGDAAWRWTDGAATLALPDTGRALVLTLLFARVGARYWLDAPPAAARAA
jgi:hypothetical protein